MKKRLLAIMDNDGRYLCEFTQRKEGVLSFEAGWTNDFENSMVVELDAVKDDEEHMDSLNEWADLLDAELVVISMDYQVYNHETGITREDWEDESYFERVMKGEF